jgi:chromosome segregation ATPase
MVPGRPDAINQEFMQRRFAMSTSTVAEPKQDMASASKVPSALKAVEQQRVELAALRQRARTAMQQTELHQDIEAAKAKLDQLNQKAFDKLDEWEQHLDADITRLNAKVNDATERTRAAIEQDVAEAREEQAQVRTQVKETFTAHLNDLKADVESLQAKAATRRSETRAKWDARIADLNAQRDAEEQRLEQLDQAQGEAWDVMSKKVRKALNSYQAAVRKAEADYSKDK